MEMKSCSMRVKKLIKVGLSQVGGDQLDLPLKGRGGGGLIVNVVGEKSIVLACVS